MSEIILKEGSTPSTPAAGQVSLYAKDGGLLYTKDDLGVEKFVGGYFDGWIPINIAPVYVSATSIRFENIDLSGAFPVGTKIKLTQTTVKYFYVIGVAYSGGNTTLTLTGGSDYTVANDVITAFNYAHGVANGFPEWFNHTPTITGWSSITSISSSFSLSGKLVNIRFRLDGISNFAGFFASLPINNGNVGQTTLHFGGLGVNGGSLLTDVPCGVLIDSGADICKFIKGVTSSTGTWSATGRKYIAIQFFYFVD